MLVSVTERTRENRRAHLSGSHGRSDSAAISGGVHHAETGGGAAGVLFGIVGSYLVGQMLKWPMEMSLGIDSGGGAVFDRGRRVLSGTTRPRKASLLDPIEALRYELR